MRTLRLHRDIYDGRAVDQAIGTYDRFATIGRREEPSHWVVEITAQSEAREQRIEGELCNYALGLTVHRARTKESTK